MRGDLNGLVLVWGEWLSASACISFRKACQTSVRDACQHQLHFFCCLSEIGLKHHHHQKPNCRFLSEYYLLLIADINISLLQQNYGFILRKGGLFHITGFILYCHLVAKKIFTRACK